MMIIVALRFTVEGYIKITQTLVLDVANGLQKAFLLQC